MDFRNLVSKILRREPDGNGRVKRRAYHARRRFRVEIINENTLGRIFTMKLSGVRAVMAAIAAVAAIVSLAAMIFMFTPLGSFLPWRLEGDMRARYLNTAMRVDSLERIANQQVAYTQNLVSILTDSVDIKPNVPNATQISDTLMAASAREQEFIRRFEEEERFNLSVLAPIAAEGMIFESPIENDAHIGEISAIYRGTVISTATDPYGFITITIQHPNDFISVYSDLEYSYVSKGDKVTAGQRIGRCEPSRPLDLEMWHKGSQLKPSDYLSY